MILKTLTLNNFRKFKQVEIEFPDGLIGVVGLNGAGKSTIFEAIAWVLYGSVAARTSTDQIKREGAEFSDPCRVELEFIFDDETYRVVREITGKSLSPSATVLVNGKLAVNSVEAVNTYIQRKLGMDYKSFFTSIYAKQKELNVLSTMNASERRPLILRMLGIDALDDVIKEIRADKKNKENIVEKLQSGLFDEKGNDKIELCTTEQKKQEQKQENTQGILKQLQEQISFLIKEVNHEEKAVLSQKKKYEDARREMETINEKKTLSEKRTQLEKDVERLQLQIDGRQRIVEKQKEKTTTFNHLEADINNVEQKLKSIDEIIENLVKTIEQKKTVIDGKQKEIREIETKKKKILQMGSDAECPTCQRVLGTQYHTLVRIFEEDIQKKLKNNVEYSAMLKTELEQHEKVIREKKAILKKRDFLNGQLREKEKIEITMRNMIAELKREKTEREQKEKQFQCVKFVIFDPKEYQTVKKQIDESYKQYQSALQLHAEKKEQLSRTKLEREQQEGEHKLIRQKIEYLQKMIKEYEEQKKRIFGEQQSLQHLAVLNDVMNSFRTHLIARIRPTLSSYASDFFERLTDGKYHDVELDEEYNLLISDNGTSYEIERFSGGEEDLANLCLRLAISEVITERAGGAFNFIILDEILGSQDTIRRQNIISALHGLSSKFRQLFLITHIDDVKNFIEHTITVLEDENGISTIKIE
ncbi:MAG: SMC family ATPase [Euryarchaeota archaeon]|nr:SMC family ATPase [Euryarchaeota archaeon]